MYNTTTASEILTCSCDTGPQAVLIFILQVSNTSKCWLPLSCNLCWVGNVSHELCSFLQWVLYLVSFFFLVLLLSVSLKSLCCVYFDLSSFYPMYFAPWALPQTVLSLAYICVVRLQSMEVILNSVICSQAEPAQAELRAPLLPVSHPASRVGFAALLSWLTTI